jgi:CRP-like cAMP-binding protein
LTVLPFPSAHPLIRKLESIFALTDEERAAIERLPLTFRDVPAGEAIVSDGDKPTHCCLVLAGLVCRCKTVGNGHRQIFMFHIRGDIPDLQSLHIEVMDHEAVALQPSKVAFIPHQDLRTLTRAYPRIADALWRDTLIDAAVFRAWLVNVGARSAYNRIAHLLCELMVRAQAVGLADGNVLEHLPTQEEIGQALGLSHVHVNRTLRDFRVNGLVTTQRRRLTVLSWEGLQQAAEFDPTYLHLRKAV